MTRRLPGKKIETIDDPITKASGELRIVPAGGLGSGLQTFMGVVAGEQRTDADVNAVRRWIVERLAAGRAVDWTPALAISYDLPVRGRRYGRFFSDGDEDDLAEKVELAVRRFYVGRVPGGEWRQLRWEDFDAARPTAMAKSKPYTPPRASARREDFALPWRPKVDSEWDASGDAVLPYDDALYLALQHVQSVIKNARAQIAALVGTEEGTRRLAAAGAQLPALLTAGAPPEPPASSGDADDDFDDADDVDDFDDLDDDDEDAA